MKINKLPHFLLLFVSFIFLSCSDNKKESDAFGNFEVDDVIVSSEVAGKITMLNAEEGKTLKKGDLIALADTVQLYLQKKQLEAQVTSVNSRKANVLSQIDVIEQQKANLQRDNNRIANMLKDGAATQKQMDDITGGLDLLNKQKMNVGTQFASLASETEVIATQINQLNDKILRCKIVSPIDGTVLEKYKSEGEIVGAGQNLAKMASLASLNLRVYVSGDQLPHIKIGQQVTVLIDDTKTTNSELKGEITWISSEAEFTPKIIQTKKERVKLVYALKVKVPNNGALKIGMPGEIRF